MTETLATIREEAEKAVSSSTTLDELESVRLSYLGKSGIIPGKLKTLGQLPPEERKEVGAELNRIKNEVSSLIERSKELFEQRALEARLAHETVDISLPVRPDPAQSGRIHPITQVMEEITAILGSMGFAVAEGPEIEDDWHNFEALNFPPNHPAREMQDTFFVTAEDDSAPPVLRTHTSSVQIRWMEKHQPPHKIIVPGRTYRCDSDITHSPMFHQVEGLYIDKNIHMGHLKGCLIEFIETFFGVSDVPVRFRPSFFPFTEPSAEVDIGCDRGRDTLKIGEGDSWLEVLGCGMVHPNVLRNVGLDPDEYQGFAFGLGVERFAMLKYGIPDLRTFFESDIRWLDHYGFAPLDIPTLVRGITR